MARFISGRAVKLSHTFLDDETVLTPDVVTVTVTAEGETVAFTTGTAIKGTDNVYTFSAGLLPEAVYTAVWDGGSVAKDVTRFEVTGGFIFSIPEARASDIDLTVQRYPASAVRAAREAVEVEFERITGRSFVPRTRRFRVEHDGVSDELLVPAFDVQAVKAVYGPTGALTGTFTVSNPMGEIAGFTNVPGGSYDVLLSYGFPEVPDDIKRAALMRARFLLSEDRSGIPDRATSFQPSEGGTYTLATPGRNGYETAIPEVDATLARYTFRILNDILGGIW